MSTQPTNLIAPKTRSIRFYAAGGTGINILRRYRENQMLERSDLYGNEQITYIDTSLANLAGVSADNVFVPAGCDGSGKDRRRNAAAIQQAMPAIMLAHQPADLNVVVFSASGGSGSVAGPLVLEHLLSEGKSVVAVISSSHDSVKSTRNAIQTLQGLELAVERQGRPIVMHYKENDPKKTLSENDILPQFVLGSLSILASGKNHHMDSADVENFFDYHRVTRHQPSLAMLNVYAREEDLVERHDRVVGFAALLKDESQLIPKVAFDYDSVGFLPEGVAGQRNSFYYTVTFDNINAIIDDLSEKKRQAELAEKVTVKVSSLRDATVTVDSSGLVFD